MKVFLKNVTFPSAFKASQGDKFVNKLLKAILALTILTGLVGCQEAELGSKDNPVKMYFTPSVDAESITSNSVEFLQFLEKETGYFFKSGVPASYVAVVEAFGSNRADIAVMNSFGYLMANRKYGANARLATIRYGEDHYRGQIITHVDTGIKSIKDLNGKKFAFTDAASTSGYMFPLKILNENKVKLGGQVFAVKHDVVATMVYQKQVDAGATYYSPPSESGKIRDARARIITQFPDIAEKVKIIAITEPIKNDPFVFRNGVSEEMTNKIITAIKKFLSTEKGKHIFETIYGVEAVVDAKNEDYDGLRKMVEINKIDPVELLKKK